MPTNGPSTIPFPLSTFPGANPQESSGRLINLYSEPLGDPQQSSYGAPRDGMVWRRLPGLTQYAVTMQSGYRGGLTVNNLAYEIFAGEALTVDALGNVILLGSLAGNAGVSIARNQNEAAPDVVVVDPVTGAFVLNSAAVLAATGTLTLTGATPTTIQTTSVTFTNINVNGLPVTVNYLNTANETIVNITAGVAAAINANTTLQAVSITADANIVTASGTITLAGVAPTSVRITSLTFTNVNVSGLPLTVTYNNTANETLANIAAGIVALINANATLIAAAITATNVGAVITITQVGVPANIVTVTSTTTASAFTITPSMTPVSSGPMITITQLGIVGNSTLVTASTTGGGFSITPSMTPSGGAGVVGVFTGVPTFYNGQTNLPQPNSVSFQDGYFFFTIGDGRVYASGINSLTQNALTFVRIEAKADVSLLRGVAYQGYMFFFTTGSCEIWQDQANPAPAFPYGRMAILAYGLIQGTAIAGFETGFDNLSWVAQDYGVYNLPQGSVSPTKVSPPDLDRLIEQQVRKGNVLQAGVYIFAGKKVWVLTSPDWTWQLHLNSMKWFERQSLQGSGTFGQWRGIGGHPGFNKWLMGDQQSGSLLFVDDTNYYDTLVQDPTTWVTSAIQMLFRLESGLVDNFPIRTRVARSDFHFVRGVGVPVFTTIMNVVGAVSGTGGVVRLQVNSTLGVNTGDEVVVTNVTGTVEANGPQVVTIIDNMHLELQGTTFVNPYISGGSVTNSVVHDEFTNPMAVISWSNDGGVNWRPPVQRNLGQLDVIKTGRVSVKNTGMTGVVGRRWRIDVSAPVYTAFLRATQSDDPTIPN